LFLARIDGWLTSTVKHASLAGERLLIGQRLATDGSDVGEPIVLVDPVGAGPGSRVLVTSDGDLARQLLRDDRTPSRMIVLGLVDEVHLSQGSEGAR
jgi:microcompartment protein CcmK/EutM